MILDLVTPVMDSFVVFEKLRAVSDYAAIPVLVLSSLDLTREQRPRLAGTAQILDKGDTALSSLAKRLRRLVGED